MPNPDEKSPQGPRPIRPGDPRTTPEFPRGSRSSLEDPEALQQLRKLQDAARLAAASKFRCEVCGQVKHLRSGIVIVARRNILSGVCMECMRRARIVIRPMDDGAGVHIGIEADPRQQIVIPAVELSDIRAVETSKLSEQTVEKIEIGDPSDG